jgi:RecA/RadA recombinase
LERAGCDVETILYVQAQSVEFVLETIEDLLANNENRMLFIWDSFNPQSSMAVKARILAKGMSKLTVPIANSQSTFLVLNQLKSNITRSPSEAMTTPYVTPGGKAMIYAYSLRVWLTGRKAKASFITDDSGFRIGSEVKVKLEKSRFGTQGRQCNFKILWGTDDIGVQDDQSLFEAIKGSNYMTSAGAWYSLEMSDGKVEKFQPSKWEQKMKDPVFKQRVYDVMDEEVIQKFDKRLGKAEDFYEEKDE